MLHFKFVDEIHGYQKFVRDNIKMLGNLIIITEQLYMKNTNKNFVDILALDLNDNRLVILELKNINTDDKILAQPIRYYDLLIRAQEDLTILLYKANKTINFDIENVNYEPKIMIVVPNFDLQLLRSFSYVNNLDIEIVKFNLLQKNGYFEIIKEKFVPDLSYQNDTKTKLNTEISKQWNLNEYEKIGINKSKILLIKQTIDYLQSLFNQKNEKLNIYYYKNKISLMIGKQVWGHILINKQTEPGLEINIKINSKKIFNYNLLYYEPYITKYKTSESSVKICYNTLPTKFISKMVDSNSDYFIRNY